MEELFVTFLLLIISLSMFALIMAILKLDKQVTELNGKVSKLKGVDLKEFKRIIELLHNINKNIKLGQLKQILDGILSAISAVQIVMLYKKAIKKFREKRAV